MGIATRAIVCGLVAGCVVTASAHAQTELDRILTRVNGHVVTASDVRQARLLKLVDDTGSDEATLHALVDRLLLLDEIVRPGSLPLAPITDADLVARRAAWEASLGGAAEARRLLATSGMTEARLEASFRDDLRIRAYLQRQFGALPDAARATAVSDLLSRLRQRAGVK